MKLPDDLDAMVDAYVETSLWAGLAEYPESEYASTDPAHHDNPEPLEDFFTAADISPTDMATICADCQEFATQNADDLADMDPGQAGHDFYLTRNHHGAGFWDRCLGERGERLTKASHAYDESALYGWLVRGADGGWTGEGIGF